MKKKIEGFENYEVSDDGRIFKSEKEVPTQVITSKCGYKTIRVNLRKNKKGYTKIVSRLVASAFVDGYFEGAQCGHKDDDSTNNNASNLYWTTPSENNEHNGRAKRVAGLKRENGDYTRHANYMKEKFSKAILQYDMNGNLIAEFESAREAERITGLNNVHIGRCAKGIYSQYKGFVWKYK